MKKYIYLFVLFFFCTGSVYAKAEKKPPCLKGAAGIIFHKSQKYIEENNPEKAAKTLCEFIKKYPKSNHYLLEYLLGNILLEKKEDKKALQCFKKSVSLYPDSFYVWQNMGKCCFGLEMYDAAAKCMKKAYLLQEKEKKNPSLLYHASIAYILAGKSSNALPVLEKLIVKSSEPPEEEWLKAYVKVCFDTANTQKGISVFERLIEKNQLRADMRRLIAKLYLSNGNYFKTAVSLKTLSYMEPLKDDELKLLGDLFAFIEIPSEAALFYETAIKNGKKDVRIYEKLASVYMVSGLLEEAEKTITKAVEQKKSSKNQFLRGMIRYELKAYKKAGDDFYECTRFEETKGRAWLMLGYCAWYDNDYKRAEKALKNAVKFKSQKKQAKDLLAYVERKI